MDDEEGIEGASTSSLNANPSYTPTKKLEERNPYEVTTDEDEDYDRDNEKDAEKIERTLVEVTYDEDSDGNKVIQRKVRNINTKDIPILPKKKHGMKIWMNIE